MKRREFIGRSVMAGIAPSPLAGSQASGPPAAPRANPPLSPKPLEDLPKGNTPLAVHPENPRYFVFRGKPLVLVSATAHYGMMVNRPFEYER